MGEGEGRRGEGQCSGQRENDAGRNPNIKAYLWFSHIPVTT